MNRFIILTFSLLVFAACAPTNSSYAGRDSGFGVFKSSGKSSDANADSESGYDPLKAHLLARAAVDPTGRKQNPYAYNYQDKNHVPSAAPLDTQLASVSGESGAAATGLSAIPFPVRKPVINGQFANAQAVEPVASVVSSSVQGFSGNMGIVPVPPHKPFMTASADDAPVQASAVSSGMMAVLPPRKPSIAGNSGLAVKENQSMAPMNTGGIPVPAHKPVL